MQYESNRQSLSFSKINVRKLVIVNDDTICCRKSLLLHSYARLFCESVCVCLFYRIL